MVLGSARVAFKRYPTTGRYLAGHRCISTRLRDENFAKGLAKRYRNLQRTHSRNESQRTENPNPGDGKDDLTVHVITSILGFTNGRRIPTEARDHGRAEIPEFRATIPAKIRHLFRHKYWFVP